MKDLFASNGISMWEFVEATVYFLGTMLAFFLLKNKKLNWLKLAFFGIFVIYWIRTLISPKPLEVKLLATLFMLSIVVIKFLVARREKMVS